MAPSSLHRPILGWYAVSARDLPWRRPGTSPWAVLVSEVMLQQTPVARVLEPYAAWVARWPTATALAAEQPGAAVKAWGRLGYPRRALRLHAAATVLVERHEGRVPADISELRALPGVGDYTAAAVASFGFGQAHPVLDTNVRRVLARAVTGAEQARPVPDAAERALALALMPTAGRDDSDADPGGPARAAATWAAAVMELGALVCTARRPRCDACPVLDRCEWQRAGRPAYDGPSRRRQGYPGSNRQARGRLLALVRDADAAVGRQLLRTAWPNATQRDRALCGLIQDGLVEELADGRFGLPRRDSGPLGRQQVGESGRPAPS